ncbi:MAG: transcription termination factor Rho [Clostridiales bacterium]|nr:transcription termination factor Rho [Clostridiales bacterium]
MALLELRAYGKQIGVKSVTTFPKGLLIEKIKETLEGSSDSGGLSVSFEERPKKRKVGRPRKNPSVSEETENNLSETKISDTETAPKTETAAPEEEPVKEETLSEEPLKTQEDQTETAQISQEETTESNVEEKPVHEVSENKYLYSRPTVVEGGVLEVMPEGYGFLRNENYMPGSKDVYITPVQIKRFSLKTGDYIEGITRPQREGDKYNAIIYVNTVNGDSPISVIHRPSFESLTPIYPNEKLRLETNTSNISTRTIDLISPIGKGQRGMIVAQPKAGKTVLIKKIANAIKTNYPEIQIIVLLIDERPEEVTDMQDSISGENVDVIYSTFDEQPEHHKKVAEMVLERAKRLVEQGKDLVILLDSITRLARAYNLTAQPGGRALSGGLDAGALYMPKKFFGAARNIREGGSLTILATALVETGSKLDDIVYEEFKGTGNMEIVLDRKLSERRVFPAIDILKSGTRREEVLLSPDELDCVYSIRRSASNATSLEITSDFNDIMTKTKNNKEFVETIKKLNH